MIESEQIAKILLEKGAVKLSANPPFKFTSGILSPIYIDNRILISHPKERQFIIDQFIELIEKNKIMPEVISGTATAAIPWAAFLSAQMELPMVYARTEPKQHGAGKQVEGEMEKGANVLIVEDLASTGGSAIKNAQACQREFGAKTRDVVVIYSHQLPIAKENFENAGLNFHYLTDFKTIIDLAIKTDYLSVKDRASVEEWQKDPANWGKKMGF